MAVTITNGTSADDRQLVLVANDPTQANYNQGVLQAAVQAGGSVFLQDSGNYYLAGDNFSPASTTTFLLGPGVAFYVNGTRQALRSLSNVSVSLASLANFRGRPWQNAGLRIFDGRTAATFAVDAGLGNTFHAVFRVAQDFDWIEPIFANGNTGGSLTVASCKVSSVADFGSGAGTTPNNNGGAWTTITLPSSGVIAAAPGANRRSYMVGARNICNTVTRTDGGTDALVAVRCFVAAGAGTITVLGAGASGASDDFTNWATRTDGNVALFRAQTGDQVTTISGFTSTTNVSYSPIIGVRYGARGRVITVGTFGDSIDSGRGTYKAEGFGNILCSQLSSRATVAFEHANFAWSGTSMSLIRSHVEDAVAAGLIPDVAIYPNISPNDITPPWVAANSSAAAFRAHSIYQTLAANSCFPIEHTCVPSDPAGGSGKNYGTSDPLRVAYNALELTLNAKGMAVSDFATPLSGATDGNGQVLPLSGTFLSDGLHPSDYGNQLLRDAAIRAVSIGAGMIA